MRQIALDTETTGLDPKEGHRVIEIGCIEIIDRRITGESFHVYINPEREIDKGAEAVHGISNAFVADKPVFKDILKNFTDFIGDAELIIHNAPFDVGFLNYEYRHCRKKGKIEQSHEIVDTLVMARKMHPRQKNSLDALCKRYQVDNSGRDYHGALIDADLLARVYLAMTGGQGSIFVDAQDSLSSPVQQVASVDERTLIDEAIAFKVVYASDDELQAHEDCLQNLAKKGKCLWEA